MVDVLTPEQRKRNMSAIGGKNTKPEITVRRLIHQLGYRFRLHRSDLPGKPDIVLPRLHKIVFVNGCYWHMHRCSYGQVVPATNTEFWQEKRNSTVDRDKKNNRRLRRMGWSVLIIWECQLKNFDVMRDRLLNFLT